MEDVVNLLSKKRITEILKARGIELNIHGCGCCGSPNVKLIIDGFLVVDESNYNLPEEEQEEFNETTTPS